MNISFLPSNFQAAKANGFAAANGDIAMTATADLKFISVSLGLSQGNALSR